MFNKCVWRIPKHENSKASKVKLVIYVLSDRGEKRGMGSETFKEGSNLQVVKEEQNVYGRQSFPSGAQRVIWLPGPCLTPLYLPNAI